MTDSLKFKLPESIGETHYVESLAEFWKEMAHAPRVQLTLDNGAVIGSRRKDGTYVLDAMQMFGSVKHELPAAQVWIADIVASIKAGPVLPRLPPSPPAF